MATLPDSLDKYFVFDLLFCVHSFLFVCFVVFETMTNMCSILFDSVKVFDIIIVMIGSPRDLTSGVHNGKGLGKSSFPSMPSGARPGRKLWVDYQAEPVQTDHPTTPHRPSLSP